MKNNKNIMRNNKLIRKKNYLIEYPLMSIEIIFINKQKIIQKVQD